MTDESLNYQRFFLTSHQKLYKFLFFSGSTWTTNNTQNAHGFAGVKHKQPVHQVFKFLISPRLYSKLYNTRYFLNTKMFSFLGEKNVLVLFIQQSSATFCSTFYVNLFRPFLAPFHHKGPSKTPNNKRATQTHFKVVPPHSSETVTGIFCLLWQQHSWYISLCHFLV